MRQGRKPSRVERLIEAAGGRTEASFWLATASEQDSVKVTEFYIPDEECCEALENQFGDQVE